MPVGQHNFHLFYTQTLISNIMELIIRECVVMRSEHLKLFSPLCLCIPRNKSLNVPVDNDDGT